MYEYIMYVCMCMYMYIDIVDFLHVVINLRPWVSTRQRISEPKRLERRREPHTHADVAVRPS